MPDSPPSLGVRTHLVAELRYMARAFVPPLLVTMLLFGVIYALIIGFGHDDSEGPSKWVLVPVAFGYGAFIGMWVGVVVGGLWLSWALVGRWTLLPLVLVPAALALALWLATDALAARVDGIEQAARVAMAEHDWIALQVGGGFAHAGPVAIVILAPLLLIDLGLVALDPGVLWAIFELLLVFALAVTAAVVPTGLLSMVVLIGAYLRRLRARIEARRAAASGAEP